MSKVIFDSPDLYAGKFDFYSDGSSPKLLRELSDFLMNNSNEISKICFASYLFNNEKLHQCFKDLNELGIDIEVFSIPLEGYDNTKPKRIIDLQSRNDVFPNVMSKYDLAYPIYEEMKNIDIDGYTLYVFPHMYIRSEWVNPFSRGAMPYSLHTKSIYIKLKNGKSYSALTSSNLAVRDLVKDECLLILENDEEACRSSEAFFSALKDNSILVRDFDENASYYDYQIALKPYDRHTNNLFTAPFFEDSPVVAENRVTSLIKAAKERIYICAQHICAIDYTYIKGYETGRSDNERVEKAGFLSEVLKKAEEGLDVRCVSQTFVDSNGNTHGCRRPQNTAGFRKFIGRYSQQKNAKYAANESVHSKYIIIDDTLIVTTCNFTPTQFIYLKHVDIPKFKKIPNISYKGIHSEVGQFIFIENPKACKVFKKNFEYLWDKKNTFHY